MMDGILSGLFSPRKKTSSDNSSSTERSDSMRLTKSDTQTDFDPVDDIGDFNFAPPASDNRVADFGRGRALPTAVIGPKIKFKGELTGEEDLLIQGQVEGSVDLKGNHLTIGSQGVIKANMTAKTITVEGRVEGDINATEHIAIKSGSQVQGNLKAERVTLEDGAKFRGAIDMDMGSDNKAEPKKSFTPSPVETTDSTGENV
jgi:cytoskeletal protein CcmA (bactofilin family)